MNRNPVPSELVFYDSSNELSRLLGALGPIAIFIDGACRGNGRGARAAYGVYFAPDAPRNSYGLLPVNTIHTNNKAEIFASLKAVDMILNGVDWPVWKDGVVLITDSDYLFQSMTKDINSWLVNGFLTSTGEPVANADEIRELNDKICHLDSCGIKIKFWKVDREHNQHANRLANLALGH